MNTLNKIILLFLGMTCLNFDAIADDSNKLNTPSEFVCQETVGCGPSVKVEGSKVILNRNLISKLSKNPSLDALEKNLWEILYFIGIGDKEAISLGIDILSLIKSPEHVQIDDDTGIRPLARTLTNTDMFWELLATKSSSQKTRILHYFDVIKCDYSLGYDYEENKNDILRNSTK